MHFERKIIKRSGLRRISRARILDGPALKVGMHAVTVMAVAFMTITAAISLLFSYLHGTGFTMALWTLLPGALLGYVLLVLERVLGRLKEHMFPGMGKLLTAFLLFFLHIIVYLAVSSLIVSYPLGFMMKGRWGLQDMAGAYSLFSANFFIILAIFSWLRNVRTPPYRCL